MQFHRVVRPILVSALVLVVCPFAAAASRTFVSSYGNDSNACSLPSPCRSFTAALAATSANGEVVVLDSAGYGPFVATANVTITAPAGVYAGITVPGSSTGASVTGGTRLVLRGLTFNGQGGASNTGVFASGAGTVLEIERCNAFDFGRSAIDIRADALAVVRDTVLSGSDYGVSVSDGGDVTIERVQATRNVQAGLGVSIGHASVTDSVFAQNARGISILPNIIGAGKVDIIRSVISGNTLVGIQAATQNPGTVDFSLTDSLVSGNATGVSAQAANGSGNIRGMLSGNTIADQAATGVFVTGDNTIVGLRGNQIVRNATGVSKSAVSTVRSLTDNWIIDNTSNVGGGAFSAVTPL